MKQTKKQRSASQSQQTSKNRSLHRVVTIILTVVMLLALILPLLTSAFLPAAHAATRDELKNQISGLQADAANASARKKELQQKLKELENDKAQALERKKILDQQLYNLDAQISNTQSQIDTYVNLIAQEEVALAEAQERETQAYHKFCSRARSMEESGTISYWSVLFQATDYSDLLDRLAMVDEIMAYDNSVVDELAAARAEVEATLASLQSSKAALDEQKAQLDVQRAEQAAKVAEAQAVFDELKGQADAAAALVAAEEAEEQRIANKIAQKQKELEKLISTNQISFDPGTGYHYPLPASCTTITSKFGWRTHPITKKPNHHTGADIAAGHGTAITAVQGGVVTISGYAPSSYGNYVVISHGNNRTTLYAHMSSRAVSEGQVVSQGQVIGYVGTTGSSSGPHLHLELRINGQRADPLTNLFPNMSFQYW